jgi:hypothetical protein
MFDAATEVVMRRVACRFQLENKIALHDIPKVTAHSRRSHKEIVKKW